MNFKFLQIMVAQKCSYYVIDLESKKKKHNEKKFLTIALSALDLMD